MVCDMLCEFFCVRVCVLHGQQTACTRVQVWYRLLTSHVLALCVPLQLT